MEITKQGKNREHYLTEIDYDARTAVCRICGPTKLTRKKHGNKYGFYCNTNILNNYKDYYSRQPAEWHQERRLKYDGRSIARKSSLKCKYNLTVEEYDEMIKALDGLCQICRNPETEKDRTGVIKWLAVDHCHTTGKVRGLLCAQCNQGLGNYRDNTDYLKAAIAYLEA